MRGGNYYAGMSPIAPIAHEKKMTGSCSACMRSHRDHEINAPIFCDIVVVADPAGPAGRQQRGGGRSDELWGRSPGSRSAQARGRAHGGNCGDVARSLASRRARSRCQKSHCSCMHGCMRGICGEINRLKLRVERKPVALLNRVITGDAVKVSQRIS